LKIIISCGSKKRRNPCPAWRFYTGSFFQAGMRYARSVAEPQEVFIISAKYELIPCTKIISPYESKMGTKTQIITPEEIQQQINDVGFVGEETLIIAGKAYIDILSRYLENFIVFSSLLPEKKAT